MKNLLFLLLAAAMLSCTTFDQKTEALLYPEILEKYPLPPIPEYISGGDLTLYTKMLIEKDGSVSNVILLYKSGNDSWDNAVKSSLRKWKYSPVIFNGVPIRLWISQAIRIQIAEPVYRTLSQIVCNSYSDADTVYAVLKRGGDFWSLAQKYSVADSKSEMGKLGSVDIQMYPEKIQREILKLGKGDFTLPLEYGRRFVIFKLNNY